MFQPFPSEVVFENYVPRQFYIATLALRNRDRVRAGLRWLNTGLEGESSGILVVCSRASYLLQHSASRMKCLSTVILRDGGNVPVLGILLLVLAVHWWYVTQRSFLSQHASP